MADPYASAGGAPSSDMPPTPSAPPTLPSGWAASQEFLGGASAGGSSPDYLFETDLDPSFRRSWGERLTFHVGGACLVVRRLPALVRRTILHLHGCSSPLSLILCRMLSCLCPWPVFQACSRVVATGCIGLRDSVGEQRIRVNKVLNSTAKIDWARQLAGLRAMMAPSSRVSRTIFAERTICSTWWVRYTTGVIYKITSGHAAAAGLGLGAFAATTLRTKQTTKSGMLVNFGGRWILRRERMNAVDARWSASVDSSARTRLPPMPLMRLMTRNTMRGTESSRVARRAF